MTQKTAFQVLVAGGKGMGKSTLTDSIARTSSRVIVFDFMREYTAKGYRRAADNAEVLKLVKAGWRRGFKIAREVSGDPVADLDALARLLCAIQQPYYDTPDGRTPPIPKILLVVEEMRWSYPNGVPRDHALASLTTLGRHYGINVIGTTQRIAEVSTNFRGTCDCRYFFRQEEARDVNAIAEMIGRNQAAALRSLAPHEYLRLFRGEVTRGKNRLRR